MKTPKHRTNITLTVDVARILKTPLPFDEKNTCVPFSLLIPIATLRRSIGNVTSLYHNIKHKVKKKEKTL